jgi:hypothetical protein
MRVPADTASMHIALAFAFVCLASHSLDSNTTAIVLRNVTNCSGTAAARIREVICDLPNAPVAEAVLR